MKVEVRPQLWLDSRRAVFLEATQTLVVADIHWGYARAHAAVGNLLPMWGDEQIAETLLSLLREYRPREMIWLGDSVHAATGARAAEAFLKLLSSEVEVHLVRGNHDKRWSRPQISHVVRSNVLLHHGDAPAPLTDSSLIEMIGHHHPACYLGRGIGNRLKVPALVITPRQIVLPAFSPWASGGPWAGKENEVTEIWALGASRVFKISD